VNVSKYCSNRDEISQKLGKIVYKMFPVAIFHDDEYFTAHVWVPVFYVY
jgi:hypothetical protein